MRRQELREGKLPTLIPSRWIFGPHLANTVGELEFKLLECLMTWDFGLSQRWLWRLLSSEILRPVVQWKLTKLVRNTLSSPRVSQAEVAAFFIVGSCVTCFSSLKMEAMCLYETSVDFHRTTRRYIPENSTWLCFISKQFSVLLSCGIFLLQRSCKICELIAWKIYIYIWGNCLLR
jgi:hypothetical protein